MRRSLLILVVTLAIGSAIVRAQITNTPNLPNPLPAVSGVNLTNLNASALASGTVPCAVTSALTGDVTKSAGSCTTQLAAAQTHVTSFAGLNTITAGGGQTLDLSAVDVSAFSRGTNPQSLILYNTYTDSTHYERANSVWAGNDFTIQTEKGSAGGTARNLRFGVDAQARWEVQGTTGDLIPLTTATYKIGSGSLGVKQIFLDGGTLAASAPIITGLETENNSGVTFHGLTFAFTETAAAAASRYIEFLCGASGTTDCFYVQKGGFAVAAGGFGAGGAAVQNGIGLNNKGSLTAPASDGVFLLTNNAGLDFNRLQFGGTTSSFPALVRSGTTLQVKLADTSGDAALQAAEIDTTGVSNGFHLSGRWGLIGGSASGVAKFLNDAGSSGVAWKIPSDAIFQVLSRGESDTATIEAHAAQFSALASATGVRYVCADTSGNLTSQSAACSGTAPLLAQLTQQGYHLVPDAEWHDLMAMRAEWVAAHQHAPVSGDH